MRSGRPTGPSPKAGQGGRRKAAAEQGEAKARPGRGLRLGPAAPSAGLLFSRPLSKVAWSGARSAVVVSGIDAPVQQGPICSDVEAAPGYVLMSYDGSSEDVRLSCAEASVSPRRWGRGASRRRGVENSRATGGPLADDVARTSIGRGGAQRGKCRSGWIQDGPSLDPVIRGV